MFAIEEAMAQDLMDDMDNLVFSEESDIEDLVLDVLEKAEEENEDGKLF